MQETKIVDGFIFAIINKEEAKDKFEQNEVVYRLYEDDTEGQILFDIEVEEEDAIFGISVGFEREFKEEFEDEAQNRFRNNDKRNFDQWLDDKINLILE